MRKLDRRLIVGGAGALAGLGAALLAYARYVEPFRWDITEIELAIAGLDPAFDGYRIAHLSDFHVDSVTTYERLYEVATIANEWNPDLYALTGDFVTAGKSFDARALTAILAAMRERKARGITETAWRTMQHFRDHRERAYGTSTNAGHEQKLGKIARAPVGRGGERTMKAARHDVFGPHIMMRRHHEMRQG